MRNFSEIVMDNKANLWGIKAIAPDMYAGFVKLPDCGTCSCAFGYHEDGYEHVSVAPRHKFRIPSWEDMATLKDIFFKDEEEAYQIMPKHSEYVNVNDRCLHLWRPANGKRLGDLIDHDKEDRRRKSIEGR